MALFFDQLPLETDIVFSILRSAPLQQKSKKSELADSVHRLWSIIFEAETIILHKKTILDNVNKLHSSYVNMVTKQRHGKSNFFLSINFLIQAMRYAFC